MDWSCHVLGIVSYIAMVSAVMGVPLYRWFISWKIPSRNGWWLEVPIFQETTICVYHKFSIVPHKSYVWLHVYIYIYTYIYIYVSHMYIYIYVCITHVYIYIYIITINHIYIYTYIYIYIYCHVTYIKKWDQPSCTHHKTNKKKRGALVKHHDRDLDSVQSGEVKHLVTWTIFALEVYKNHQKPSKT